VTAPDVRVGIVSWNTAALLDRCLSALPAALGGLRAEVIVVDNASADDSVNVARGHAGVRVELQSENLGYARGMNLALAGSTAPVLLALNPDTEAAPGSLAHLIDVLGRERDVGLLAPRLVDDSGRPQHSAYRFPSPGVSLAAGLLPSPFRQWLGPRLALEGAALPERASTIDWAIGAVHCLRASALNGGAPYSERWFMYVEDMDLCWRLRRDGWQVVFDPGATVTHTGNAAGELAWGESRTARWLAATYDWLTLNRGPRYAREWAAANVVAAGGRFAYDWTTSRGPLATRGRGPSRRHQAVALAAALPVHARALRGGAAAVAELAAHPEIYSAA